MTVRGIVIATIAAAGLVAREDVPTVPPRKATAEERAERIERLRRMKLNREVVGAFLKRVKGLNRSR